MPKQGRFLRSATKPWRNCRPARVCRPDLREFFGISGTPPIRRAVPGMILAREAVEGRLIVVGLLGGGLGKPGVELCLDCVDIPAGEIAPDPRQRLVGQRGAEQRQWA